MTTLQKINEFLSSNGGNYLEIGVYYGETFFQVAKANPFKQLYGIDPFIADGWTGQQRGSMLSEAEQVCNEKLKSFPNSLIYKMTSKDFQEKMLGRSEGMNVSMVFIDGSHWLEDVQVDYDLAMSLIGDKHGLIIFDDLHLHGVREAINEFTSKYKNVKLAEDSPIYEKLGGWYLIN